MVPDDVNGSLLQIVQDVRTRWNSIFYMIDHLLQLRWPICAVLSDITITIRDNHYLAFQPSSWDLLEQLRNVLHPLQVATTYLSSKFNVSVSAVLPVIHGIVNIMQPEDNDSTAIRNFKRVVTRELNGGV